MKINNPSLFSVEKNTNKQRIILLAFVGFALSFGVLAALAPLVNRAFAANSPTINSVSLNGGTDWTNSTNGGVLVNPNGNKFTAAITVKTGSSTNLWKSTSVQVEGESATCFSTNHSNGTFTDSLSVNQPATQGKYNVSFKAYDQASCVGTGSHVSSTFTINNALIIDTTPPTNPSSVNGAAVGSVLEVSWSGNGQGAASDNASGVAGFSYKFTSSPNSDADSSLNLSASATGVSSDGLKNGSYYFHIKTQDNAGNWSQTSHWGPFTINVPPLPASDSLGYDVNEEYMACGSYTNQLHVNPTWNSVAGAVGYEISLDTEHDHDGDSDHNINVGNSTSYSWTLTAGDGTHKYKVRAIDAYGNKGTWSEECSITIDQTAPIVDAGSDHLANAEFNQSDASASDENGIATYAWSKVSGPGDVTISDSTTLNPDFSADTDGTYEMQLTVTDYAGNSASDTFSFEWDATNPESSFSTTPNEISNDLNPTFTFDNSDNRSGSENLTVECQLDDGEFVPCTSPYTISVEEGSHTLNIRITDEAGNVQTYSYSWVVDVTAPVISLIGDSPTTIIVGEEYVDEGATASDNNDGDLTSEIEVTNNVDNTKPGRYSVVYTLRDAAGNNAISVTRTVIVYDNNGGTTPTVEAEAPNNGDVNNDGTPDNEQANVTSFVNPVTGAYSALENEDGCDNVTVIQKAVAELPVADGNNKYPAGLMNFTLTCGEERAGLTVTVVQYYLGLDPSNLVLRKFNERTGTYTTITGATFEEYTIDGQQATKVTYQITDGGDLDEDGVANGTIVDPSGPAVVSNNGGTPNTGLPGHSIPAILAALVIGSGLLFTGAVLRVRRAESKE